MVEEPGFRRKTNLLRRAIQIFTATWGGFKNYNMHSLLQADMSLFCTS